MKSKRPPRKTLTACISPEVIKLLDKYLSDTFFRSRSRAIESIIINHLFELGYIDEIDFTRLKGGYSNGEY